MQTKKREPNEEMRHRKEICTPMCTHEHYILCKHAQIHPKKCIPFTLMCVCNVQVLVLRNYGITVHHMWSDWRSTGARAPAGKGEEGGTHGTAVEV